MDWGKIDTGGLVRLSPLTLCVDVAVNGRS